MSANTLVIISSITSNRCPLQITEIMKQCSGASHLNDLRRTVTHLPLDPSGAG